MGISVFNIPILVASTHSLQSSGNTELVIHNMGGNNSKPCARRNKSASECKSKSSCEWVKGQSAFSTGYYCRNKKGRDDGIMLDSFKEVLEEVLDTIDQNRWDKDESS